MEQSPLKEYKFCPKCAGNLERKDGNLLKCAACGHDHFVNQAPTAGAIICNDDNKVLLVKRKRDPCKGTWQLPGGFLELEESYEQALLREIKEELQVEVKILEFAHSSSEHYLYSGVKMPILCLFSTAKIISGEITPSDDVEEAGYFSVEDFSKLNFHHKKQRQFLSNYLAARGDKS